MSLDDVAQDEPIPVRPDALEASAALGEVPIEAWARRQHAGRPSHIQEQTARPEAVVDIAVKPPVPVETIRPKPEHVGRPILGDRVEPPRRLRPRLSVETGSVDAASD
jgi:hypothetical protein